MEEQKELTDLDRLVRALQIADTALDELQRKVAAIRKEEYASKVPQSYAATKTEDGLYLRIAAVTQMMVLQGLAEDASGSRQQRLARRGLMNALASPYSWNDIVSTPLRPSEASAPVEIALAVSHAKTLQFELEAILTSMETKEVQSRVRLEVENLLALIMEV